MKKLDGYSYQCGVIDAFNEVVRAGVKRIALSHPVDSREEAMELIPFSQQICQQYGNHFYLEESPLLTDLFPISLNKGKYNIIYYRQEEDIRQYLALKKENSSYWSSRHIKVRHVGRLRWSTANCCPTRRRQSSGILHKMRKKSKTKQKEEKEK